MSDLPTINVTGTRGGNVGTANTAGTVHGGMGNRTNREGDNYAVHGGNVGQMGQGAQTERITVGGGAGNTAKASLSSAQLLEEVRRAEVSDDTLKIFEANKITGAVFLDDEWEETQKDVGITKPMDIIKLNTLRRNLKRDQ